MKTIVIRTRHVPLLEPVFYHARTRVVSPIRGIDNLNKLQLIEGPEASNFQYRDLISNGNSNTILFNLLDIYFPGFKFLSLACYLPLYTWPMKSISYLQCYKFSKFTQFSIDIPLPKIPSKRIELNSPFRTFTHKNLNYNHTPIRPRINKTKYY